MRAESLSLMAKQIECSELAWVIRTTDIPASLRHEKRRLAVPGTPIIPAPSRLIRDKSSMVVIPLTLLHSLLSNTILVPVEFGLKVFLIYIGMPLVINGDIVLG